MVYRLPPWRLSAVFSTLEQVLDWSLALLGVQDAWVKTRGSYQKADGSIGRVKVLVIDTGIQVDPMTGRANHPDLVGAFVAGRDFTGSPFGIGDQNGHGTATAALIAANDNDAGIVGVASEADVYIAKGLGDDGSGDNAWIAQAVQWGDELDVDVISFSGGSPQPDPILKAAIDQFLDRREERFFIAAAGNDGTPNSVNYPASDPRVLAVGAVDREGRTATFSSRGEQVDCAGPGVGVKSANNRGSYGTYNGTSFACPLIAGVVVLMLAHHRDSRFQHATPLKTFNDLIEHIKRASIRMMMDEDGQGWGITKATLEDEPAPASEPGPRLQVALGPLVWTMPAQAGDLASVGISKDVPAEQRAQAERTLAFLIQGMADFGANDHASIT